MTDPLRAAIAATANRVSMVALAVELMQHPSFEFKGIEDDVRLFIEKVEGLDDALRPLVARLFA